MKRPSLRVTKWLGDIPVAGECASCAGVRFDAKSTTHRPTRQEYQQSLQRQFDAHLKQVHSLADASPPPEERSEKKVKKINRF